MAPIQKSRSKSKGKREASAKAKPYAQTESRPSAFTAVEKPALPPQPARAQTAVLRFQGSKNFRERIICSTLSGKAIRIDNIRSHENKSSNNDDEQLHVGIRDYEASFLRLIEKLTNGSSIVINETGTALKYTPGVIIGGFNSNNLLHGLQHNCPVSRGVGYFIEPIIKLCLFAKAPIDMLFTGVTNNELDVSVDVLRTVTVQLLKHFGVTDSDEVTTGSTTTGVVLKCLKRGALPLGGGEVRLRLPIIKSLIPIHLVDEGRVQRVRGLAYTTKCSPQFANRMVDAARGVLNALLPDVYIYTDHYKGVDGGNSSGYAISLVAESTTGVLYSGEACGSLEQTPEEVGITAARVLLHEIKCGGCVDSTHQSLMLLLMVLTPEDVSKIRLGKLTSHTVECLRVYQAFWGTQFMLTTEPATQTVFASCLGVGHVNVNRKAV